MPVQRREKCGFFSCCRDEEIEMVLGRRVEVRNVMPDGLGGHLGEIQCVLPRRHFTVSQRQTTQEETGTRPLLLLSGKEVATWLVVGACALFWRVELGAVARSRVVGVTRFLVQKPGCNRPHKNLFNSTPSRRLELGSGAIEPGRGPLRFLVNGLP
jgi:hypothetical protein